MPVVPAAKAEIRSWQLAVKVLMEHLGSSLGGLSSAEAALRLTRYGPNLIHAEQKRAVVLQFLAKLHNPWSSFSSLPECFQPSREMPPYSSTRKST